MKCFILVAALAAVACADHAPSYHAPHHGDSYNEPQYKPTEAHYAYKYGVDATDAYGNYVQFGADEERNGYSTTGNYRVLLPDGRTQIVYYNTADAYSGNVMDVKYEGKASYHEPAPHHAAPHKAPAYHAPVHKAPAYHAPVHHAPVHHAPIYHA